MATNIKENISAVGGWLRRQLRRWLHQRWGRKHQDAGGGCEVGGLSRLRQSWGRKRQDAGGGGKVSGWSP
uniref:Uncharacterized protein n=1 Tax=Oryza rufipogon TaxID=4529 RepID=A0A0E0NUE2_ORYRU